jgi:8-oxo-dGTP pyrophosphatase MutT (NUDIX family)
MLREISAGGVVVRRNRDRWLIAVIEPQRDTPGMSSGRSKAQKPIIALPKGLVDPGESAEQTALREVREETGLTSAPVAKLANIKYVYVRSWGDKERVFKIVTFFLFKYVSGRIGCITPEMRIEVKRAQWIPLDDAEKLLAYRGEREIARRALDYLKAHPEI